jgi:phosphoribosyl-AMP cyclohydrolase
MLNAYETASTRKQQYFSSHRKRKGTKGEKI